MATIECHRCGTCCQSFLATIPKYNESNLSPGFLKNLGEMHGQAYVKKYWKENSEPQEKRCKWLKDEPDGTTTCTAYNRRSSECADFPEYTLSKKCRFRKT